MDKILQFFKNLNNRFQGLTPVNKAVALGLLALEHVLRSTWLRQIP